MVGKRRGGSNSHSDISSMRLPIAPRKAGGFIFQSKFSGSLDVMLMVLIGINWVSVFQAAACAFLAVCHIRTPSRRMQAVCATRLSFFVPFRIRLKAAASNSSWINLTQVA